MIEILCKNRLQHVDMHNTKPEEGGVQEVVNAMFHSVCEGRTLFKDVSY